MTKNKEIANTITNLDNYKKFVSFVIDNSPAIIMILLIAYNCFFTPNFAQLATLNNLIIQCTSTVLVGIGMTWVIASGGIDISVGATMAVASMMSVKLLSIGVVPAILITLLVTILIGSVIGFIVAKFNIQPIIVTLPFMIGLRGLAQILNNSKILRFDSASYIALGRNKLFGVIPVQIIVIIVVVAIAYIITNKTVFGKKVEAIGDNCNAAVLSGINKLSIIICVYVVTSFLSGVAGIIDTARVAASDANTIGLQLEMDAIAAVVIGGTSMTGGKPNIIGTVYGAVIIRMITTMVNMNNIQFEYSLIIKAAVIVLTLFIQRMLKNKKEEVLRNAK